MLHLVNFSPAGRGLFARCLSRTMAGDCILLIESGVTLAIRGSLSAVDLGSVLHKVSVYALDADLQARGIAVDQVITGIQVIDFPGFVKLAAENGPIHSWFL